MKIQILSDLHLNINSTHIDVELNKDADLIIFAGDVSGSPISEYNYLKELKGNIICIAGNHLCYDYSKDLDDSLDFLRSLKSVMYLENEFVDFNDIIFFGGTMYTNFMLYGRKLKEKCMNIAKYGIYDSSGINDFKFVYTKNRIITPDDYIKRFNLFKRELKRTIEKTTKDIVVISHFAPSIKSVSDVYLCNKYYLYNAFFASNLEKFIKENSRIKMWIHGHMHDPHDYYISDCHVICAPCDYWYNKPNLTTYRGRTIEFGK